MRAGAEDFSMFLQNLRGRPWAQGTHCIEQRRAWFDRMLNDPRLRAKVFAMSALAFCSMTPDRDLLDTMDPPR